MWEEEPHCARASLSRWELLAGTAAHLPTEEGPLALTLQGGSWPLPSPTGSTAAGRLEGSEETGPPCTPRGLSPTPGATAAQESTRHLSPEPGRGSHAFSETREPFVYRKVFHKLPSAPECLPL